LPFDEKNQFLNVSKFSPKSLENICISSTQIFWKKSFHTKPKFFCGFVENSKQSITKLKYPFREKDKSLHQYRISKNRQNSEKIEKSLPTYMKIRVQNFPLVLC